MAVMGLFGRTNRVVLDSDDDAEYYAAHSDFTVDVVDGRTVIVIAAEDDE